MASKDGETITRIPLASRPKGVQIREIVASCNNPGCDMGCMWHQCCNLAKKVTS